MKKLNDLSGDENWVPGDVQLFEKCFLEYGMELSEFEMAIPQKSMKDIVSFFYKWKNSPLFISLYNQHRAKTCSKRKSGDLKLFAALSEINSDASSESDAGPVVDLPAEGVECGLCKIKKSEKWGVKYVPKRVFLCVDCDLHWMKYSVSRDDIDNLKKLNTQMLKKEIVEPSNAALGKRKLSEESPPKKKNLLLHEVEKFVGLRFLIQRDLRLK